MPDGRLIFSTKLDNSNIEKDLNALKRKIEKSQESIAKAESAKLPLTKQVESLNKELEKAETNLKHLKRNLKMEKEEQSYGEKVLENANATPETVDPAYLVPVEEYQRIFAEQGSWKDVIKESETQIKEQEKEIERLKSRWEKANIKVEDYDTKILQANADIQRATEEAAELNSKLASPSQVKMAQAMDKANNSAQNFGKRLLEIGKSALVFNLVSSGLRSVVNYMGTALRTNSEYTAQLAQLKGALMTAFQPIYEYVLPGAIAVLRVLTLIVSVVANVLSVIFGKTASQSAQNAKQLNKQATAIGSVGDAAEEASKQLMGFDEINKLESTESAGTSGGGGGSAGAIEPDFSAFETAEYKAKIDELTVYLSGALLALGAILAFSGVNIPLGLGLMAVGALGLAAVVKENWGSMSDDLKGALGTVAAILGGAALALGAVLAFSGVNVPLGLALMAAGAVALEAATKLDWNNIQNTLEGPVGKVVAIVSGALLALGAILAFSGVNVPLGIGLISVGAAGLAAATAANWNSIEQALKGPIGGLVASLSLLSLVFGAILLFSGVNIPLGLALVAAGLAGTVATTAVNWDFIKGKVSEIGEWLKSWIDDLVGYLSEAFSDGFINGLATLLADALVGLWNLFVEFVNSIIKNWNDIWTGISSYQTTGSIGDVGGGSMPAVASADVPALASGAVIPPNRKFMAVLGDQTSGTNIEAPLDTIKQALAEVIAQQGSGGININFTGDLAQLARVLTPEVTRAQRNNDRSRGR